LEILAFWVLSSAFLVLLKTKNLKLKTASGDTTVASVPVRKLSKDQQRRRVHARVRMKVSGTPERPRLCIYRSSGHIYTQVIDDRSGTTLVSASSVDKETKKNVKGGGNIASAKAIGKAIADRAKAVGINKVVFDRGGYKYHGRVKALADAAREAGLQF
jgi:large subunit ribosomal protein L18